MRIQIRSDKPDFGRLRAAFAREEPDRVPAMEVVIDPRLKTAFMGRPLENLVDEVTFWMEAGYDSVTLNAWMFLPGEGPEFAMEVNSEGKRQFSTGIRGLIQTWEDYEKHDWDQEKVDLRLFEEIRPLLPPGVKTIAYGGKIFSTTWMMMGFEHFCQALYADEELVGEVFPRYGEITLEVTERLVEIDTVGAIWVGDDQAHGDSVMIHPDFLRKHVYPYYKKVCDVAHAKNIATIFHSDGNLTKIIPDLIACGFDCLHPFEPDAMNIVEAKKDYGSKVCISGNVDLGSTLTKGTPTDVEAEVRRLIRELAPGGGYVVSSSNSMTEYVPYEKFLAVMRTVHEAGHYPITI